MKKSILGFTLIELLVAITIIAILSLIGLSMYSSAQSAAKDAKRKKDIDAIANALEQKFDPVANTFPAPNDSMFQNGLPKDPATQQDYSGYPEDGALAYTICAKLDNNNGNSSDASGSKPSGQTATYYCKKNSQGLQQITSAPFLSLCADGSSDQVFQSNMVGCNGAVAFGDRATLCSSDPNVHVCYLDEYLSRGGDSIPSTSPFYWIDLSSTGNQQLCSSSRLCNGSACYRMYGPGAYGVSTYPAKKAYADSCSTITSSNVGYLNAYPASFKKGAMCCSN